MLHNHEHQHQPEKTSSRGKWVLIGFLAVGAFFLLTEHRAHLFGILPYLLILACPLMHLFHGHGDHGGDGQGNVQESGQRSVSNDMPAGHDHAGRKS